MEARRIAAVVSLGLAGVGVIGLVITGGSNDQPTSAAQAPVEASAGPDAEDSPDDQASAVDQAPPVSQESSDEASDGETDPVVETVAEVPTEIVVDPNTPELPNRGPHPEFLPVQEWLQTDATSFDDFDGKVVAVQFWTFGCRNCQATWPHMRDLYEKYAGDDFEIVGVHAPEFDFERDVDAVANAAAENGIVWPIAIDNDKLNFRSWQERRFWPRVILLDADGNVRYDHIGEGAYDEIDAAVGALIAESNA